MNYIQGDIIEAFDNGEIDFIAHQCNMTLGLGAGVALALAKRFPQLIEKDKDFRRRNLISELGGRVLFHDLHHSTGVFNIYAQINGGGCVSYSVSDCFEQRLLWLKHGLVNMKVILKNDKNLGIPLIASGLAADPKRKKNMSDLEYFKTFIAPTVESVFPDCNVYYL